MMTVQQRASSVDESHEEYHVAGDLEWCGLHVAVVAE